MKIYEIGTGYTPIPAQMGAATEIVVEELVKAFQKRNAEVVLLDIQARERTENTLPIQEVAVPNCFSGTDVKLGIMHKLKRVVYSVALAGKLNRILRESKEKVLLHFHNQYNMFFFLKLVPAKIRAKAKIAYTVHSYIWPAPWAEIRETVQKRYFQEITCVQNADYVLVLNDMTAEHFTRHLGVPAERIYKIGNGVNTDTYCILGQEERELVKQDLGFAGKRVIFQVGSVCDRKNQFGAVKMLKDYMQANPDVVYAYAGGVIDPEYQAQMEQYVRENRLEDQVRYVGELCPGQQLNQYYNAASLTVFPSKLESFGLVIIESLSAGAPVLMASKPLFALEQGYVIYTSEGEFERYVDTLLRADSRADQARSEVCVGYSWDKAAGDHLGIWNK